MDIEQHVLPDVKPGNLAELKAANLAVKAKTPSHRQWEIRQSEQLPEGALCEHSRLCHQRRRTIVCYQAWDSTEARRVETAEKVCQRSGSRTETNCINMVVTFADQVEVFL